MKFASIGFGNSINADRVLAVVMPDTLPTKRMISEAKDGKTLIDATCGRKTRAVLIMEDGHVVLCGLQAETLIARFNSTTADLV